MKYLDEAIAQNPDDWDSLTSRGSLFLMQRKFDKAIADLSRAELAGPSAGIYELLGVAYLEKGDTTKAVEYLEKSVHTMCCQPHQMHNALSTGIMTRS